MRRQQVKQGEESIGKRRGSAPTSEKKMSRKRSEEMFNRFMGYQS